MEADKFNKSSGWPLNTLDEEKGSSFQEEKEMLTYIKKLGKQQALNQVL